MGRYIGPKNKIARRFGVNLGLKTNAAKVARRLQQPPGVHGPHKRMGNMTGYGKQMLEKQKAKFVYGLRERQLRKYVTEASRLSGDSGVNLQQLLEMRLDNVVYRLGFTVTRAQARQMVGHGMFMVNGKKMSIASHCVSVGDEITVKPNKRAKKIFDGMSEKAAKVSLPSWVSLDASTLTGKVLHKPAADDVEKVFDVKLIIEFYSSR